MASVEKAFSAQLDGLMARQTDRDRQRRVGPSGIGNVCERCLGLDLAGIIPDGPRPDPRDPSQGLKAWVGTAIHLKLQEDGEALQAAGVPEWQEVAFELKDLVVGEIPGYGTIKGTGDIVHYGLKVVGDFKSSDMAKIRSYQLNGIPYEYRVQRQAYGIGVKALGYKVKKVMNRFIPRDSNSFTTCWDHYEKFDPGIVEKALERATRIWEEVVNGRVNLLRSHPSCFNCSRKRPIGRIRQERT